jgi:hypothetical protein
VGLAEQINVDRRGGPFTGSKIVKRAKATSLTAAAIGPIERRSLDQQFVSRILEPCSYQ